MVLLDVVTYWYLFVVFAGTWLVIAGIVLLLESRSDKEEILHINPFVVVRNIILNQIGFYMFYLLVTFTLDIVGFEIFWWTQVFTAVEFDFITKRGLLTSLALILTMAASSIVTTSTVQTYRNMLDYCFTVFVLHFVVVSVVAGNFPAYGAWWAASAVGLIFFMILSERLSYHLETMSYESSLHEATYKSRKSKKEETHLPTIDDKEDRFSSSSSFSSQRKLSNTEIKPEVKGHSEKDQFSDDVQSEEEEALKRSEPKRNRLSSIIIEEPTKTEPSTVREEKEKKGSLRKRKALEEKHLEETTADEAIEEAPTRHKRGSAEKKIPGLKSLQLKEEESGKKDNLKAARSRDSLKLSPSPNPPKLEGMGVALDSPLEQESQNSTSKEQQEK